MSDAQVMKVELHYYFSDDAHQMNAFVRHHCEGELLRIIEQISIIMDINIVPQTEAYVEGGLKEIWSFAKRNQYVLGIVTGVLINVLSNQINIDREHINLQKESLHLEIQQKKLEIEKLKKEIEIGEPKARELMSDHLVFILNNEYRVIRSRSDFYKILEGYERITKISGQQTNANNQPISDPIVIDRAQFRNFILSTDELPMEIDEAASIEVVSPVLKKGKYKWRGIYKGSPIDFYMKDSEFKSSIFHQQVSFTNGVSLDCVLVISKKMNEIGDIYVSNYSVPTVISYHFGEDTIETTQGKKYLRDKKYRDSQLKLFDKE